MPMSDDVASVSLNLAQKSAEMAVELIKMLAPLAKKAAEKIIEASGEKTRTGQVSRAELINEAAKANCATLSNSNFLAGDAESIAAKAKNYGIPVTVTGDGEKATISFLERDKDVMLQIEQEVMRDRMKTAPQSVKQFEISECNISAMKAEFEKNGVDCCFAQGASGKFYCLYPSERAEEVQVIKNDFTEACNKIAYDFKAYPENGRLMIEDAKQQKKFEFSDKLTEANVKNVCMEQLGFSKIEAEFAARKLYDDINPVQNKLMMEKLTADKYFGNTKQLDAVKLMKTNIRYESDSILLRDVSFGAFHLADGEHTHISVMNGDKSAFLTPAVMSREDMKKICVTELDMDEKQADEAVDKCVKIDTQLNSKTRETAIFRNTGEAQTVEIDRTSSSSFSVKVGTTRRNYNFSDKDVSAKIAKDFGITESKAQSFVDKAQQQSAFLNNLEKTAKSAANKAKDMTRNLKENLGKGTRR